MTTMRNTLALTLTFGDTKIEIHTLNPNGVDCIERFGGSKHACFAQKTASIVERKISPMGVSDLEMDIFDKNFWSWIARLINEDSRKEFGILPVATTPSAKE